MADTAVLERKRLQDRVPIDVITADARQADPGRAAQAVLGGLIFGIAWLVAKVFVVAFRSLAWCASAAKMGWRSARGEELVQPGLDEVLEENAVLRKTIEQLDSSGDLARAVQLQVAAVIQKHQR